jgi:hypothetical protein
MRPLGKKKIPVPDAVEERSAFPVNSGLALGIEHF